MRLAIVADIHGNLPALEAVMADMAQRGVDAVVNLGDCVSGPLWPRETLALLRAQTWPTVRGNHDRWVGCGEADGLGLSDRFAWQAIAAEGRAWLRDLPPTVRLPDDMLAMHACPVDDDRYLLEDQSGSILVPAAPETVAARLGDLAARTVLTGHSHLPRVVQLPDGALVINPGSVGCAAYDDDATDPPHMSEAGSAHARYAILNLSPRGLVAELLAAPYDHASAASRAEGNGRPDWAYALRTGFVRRAGRRRT